MDIIEAYRRSYAQKNKEIRDNLRIKKKGLAAEKKAKTTAAEDAMRSAYVEAKRREAVAGQAARVKSAGSEQNAAAGVMTAHTVGQRDRVDKLSREVAALEAEAKQLDTKAEGQIARNEAALTLKKDQLAIKEAEAAAKAAQKAAKKSSSRRSSGSSSSKNGSSSKSGLTRAQILSLMRGGVYESWFAGALGISDEAVRTFIAGYTKEEKKQTETDTRLPGTYKPPLK